jgi:integrase
MGEAHGFDWADANFDAGLVRVHCQLSRRRVRSPLPRQRRGVPRRGPASRGHPGRLSLHSLRHTFASLLIANGPNVVFVSRQLGHAYPTVTLSTYAHLFQQADHAATAREALETSYMQMGAVATL